MIIVEGKPLPEIVSMLAPFRRVFVLGCGTCATVCLAGGEKEAREMAEALLLYRQQQGEPLEVKVAVVERQCERELLDSTRREIEEADAVLSLSCGIGVQCLNSYYPQKVALPAINTKFLGYPERLGVWQENCRACGDCLLDYTLGICPITRCAKSLQNGPCGGSKEGKCEISAEVPCAWQQIIERWEKHGTERFPEIRPPRDWSAGAAGGPKTVVKGDVAFAERE